MDKHWTLETIPWDRFDAGKIDNDVLSIVKAAALVEVNSSDYVRYLDTVFRDDVAFRDAARNWGEEEEQHGRALGRWAELADPSFDFEDSLRRFRDGFRIALDSETSVRGSRSAELIARCVVECGTSSFYSAIRDATDEPVLKDLCHRIAGDEFRHYQLFYRFYKRYREREPLNLARRLWVAFSRVRESGDDEIAYAFYSANGADAAYDRERNSRLHMLYSGRVYRYGHVARAVAMILKACDVAPQGRLSRLLAKLVWRGVCWRNRRLEARIAA